MEKKNIRTRLPDLEDEIGEVVDEMYNRNTNQDIPLNTWIERIVAKLYDISRKTEQKHGTVKIYRGNVYITKEESNEEFEIRRARAIKTAETRRLNILKKARIPKSKEYDRYVVLKNKFKPIEDAVEELARQETQEHGGLG